MCVYIWKAYRNALVSQLYVFLFLLRPQMQFIGFIRFERLFSMVSLELKSPTDSVLNRPNSNFFSFATHSHSNSVQFLFHKMQWLHQKIAFKQQFNQTTWKTAQAMYLTILMSQCIFRWCILASGCLCSLLFFYSLFEIKMVWHVCKLCAFYCLMTHY